MRRARAGAHVDARRVVGLLRFLIKLIARRVAHGLGAVGREVFLEIRRALFTQAGLGVPADLRADPLAAARALFEIALGLFDGLLKRRIVRLAAGGALNLVSAVAGARKDAAEQVAGGAQQPARRARQRRLEARHIPVAAFVTVKLELIALVG